MTEDSEPGAHPPTDLYHQIGKSGALLGLDLGTKTIGVAVCDPDRRVATPVMTVKRRKFSMDLDAVLNIAQDRNAIGCVIGLPLNMDGSEGPRAQSTRAFVRNAATRTQIPFYFWDERLSSQAVDREMIALDTSRNKRHDLIDQMAATFILQGAIDFLRNKHDVE